VVNLGYGEAIRIDELAPMVLRAVGRADLKPVHDKERPGDVPRLWVDTTKLRAAIPFQPKVSLEQGLVPTIEYFRKVYAENPRCLEQISARNWEV
jgi:UDP-glucose 4-epimerase